MTGGPGCSSILAMVTENGPCLVKKGNASEAWKMQRNPWSWTEVGTVLWVDQPGEVGFSIGAESDDELGVSERMLVFMLAFYERYPSLLKAP
ncbi:SCPL49, partial [Symbiodinium pilosum]